MFKQPGRTTYMYVYVRIKPASAAQPGFINLHFGALCLAAEQNNRRLSVYYVEAPQGQLEEPEGLRMAGIIIFIKIEMKVITDIVRSN